MRRPSRADRDDALHILNSADWGRIALGDEERDLLSRFALASMMDGRLSDAECARAREIIGWYSVLAAAPRMRRTVSGRRKRIDAKAAARATSSSSEIPAMRRATKPWRLTAAWLLAVVSAAIGTAGLLDMEAGRKPVREAAAHLATPPHAATLAANCRTLDGRGTELAALTTDDSSSGGPSACSTSRIRQERGSSLPALLPH